jgi:hypothetical protein
LNNGIELFVYKKTFVYALIVAGAALAFGRKEAAALGVILGAGPGIFRFRLYSKGFRKTFSGGLPLKPAAASFRILAVYMLNQTALAAMLYIAFRLDAGLFFGFTAGILIVPLILLVNGITEAAGITHNNFQSQVPK